MAVQTANYSGVRDEDRAAHAMADPEIQQILAGIYTYNYYIQKYIDGVAEFFAGTDIPKFGHQSPKFASILQIRLH